MTINLDEVKKFNGHPKLFESEDDIDPFVESFEKAGWHKVRDFTKDSLASFQDIPPSLPRVNGFNGRGHCRIYRRGGRTIVTCHGDTPVPHDEDPKKTEETVKKVCNTVWKELRKKNVNLKENACAR